MGLFLQQRFSSSTTILWMYCGRNAFQSNRRSSPVGCVLQTVVNDKKKSPSLQNLKIGGKVVGEVALTVLPSRKRPFLQHLVQVQFDSRASEPAALRPAVVVGQVPETAS